MTGLHSPNLALVYLSIRVCVNCQVLRARLLFSVLSGFDFFFFSEVFKKSSSIVSDNQPLWPLLSRRFDLIVRLSFIILEQQPPL